MQPAEKAAGRRQRVAIFGGAQNETQGRRHKAGKIFNRRKPTGPQGPATPDRPAFSVKDSWDRDYQLKLNPGATPNTDLWSSFQPDVNPWTGTYSSADGRGYDYGTLSTGARGYFAPDGTWTFEDFGGNDSGE